MRRIGILSGAFDPVHIGHIQAALACRETLGLDKVLLIPFGKPLIREPEAAPLHTLGSGQWDKAKKKAAEQVRDTAAELLHLYAQRAARKGHEFSFKTHDLENFAAGFGFEETPDQLAAIGAVITDMVSGKPMDRLVCGDVGFGKTEVAMRAAFVAVADGKQVAVLCPTTLLAEQHYQNFSDRFADWPVKVAEISRFKSKKEQMRIVKELEKGSIDIIIGTHRLLSNDIVIGNLGLLIIDEEHRFGGREMDGENRARYQKLMRDITKGVKT